MKTYKRRKAIKFVNFLQNLGYVVGTGTENTKTPTTFKTRVASLYK
jgi:hypothetical protein